MRKKSEFLHNFNANKENFEPSVHLPNQTFSRLSRNYKQKPHGT